jgi:hypothetical protein
MDLPRTSAIQKRRRISTVATGAVVGVAAIRNFGSLSVTRRAIWLVDLHLHVAMTAVPQQPWRILSSDAHSTVWNGDTETPILFDLNFLALEISPEEALRLASIRITPAFAPVNCARPATAFSPALSAPKSMGSALSR